MKKKRLLLMVPLLMLASVMFALDFNVGDLSYSTNRDGTNTVTVSLYNKSATAVTIPATVPYDGTTYTVTQIAEQGFTNSGRSTVKYTYKGKQYTIDDSKKYQNTTLQSVTFEQPSNIKTIGAHAFQTCTQLTSIVIPNSVETIGTAAFKGCSSLKDVSFQTKEDGTVSLKVIPTQCFRYCPLTSIVLPEGITEIGNEAFQFNLELKTIKLPNTLTKIGTHFLCDAKSLTTLTLPASVTYIDGAAFHGCESLTSVYLLGPASTLKASDGDGNETFGANGEQAYAPNCGKVKNCTFYTTWDYGKGYEENNVWKKVDQPNDNNNDIVYPIPGTEREFTANKWVTAIFPHEVENYKSTFGDNAMMAEMISAERDTRDMDLYHVTFRLIAGDNIPANRPLMFYPSKDVTYEMYNAADQEDAQFKLAMTKKWTESVTADDGAVVSMSGKYLPEKLVQYEFYFTRGQFYRVPDDDHAATVGNCRCWWSISRDGVRSASAKAAAMPIDDSVTGISGVNKDNIKVSVSVYDLNGRRIATSVDMLPQGIYIINGKKLIIK